MNLHEIPAFTQKFLHKIDLLCSSASDAAVIARTKPESFFKKFREKIAFLLFVVVLLLQDDTA